MGHPVEDLVNEAGAAGNRAHRTGVLAYSLLVADAGLGYGTFYDIELAPALGLTLLATVLAFGERKASASFAAALGAAAALAASNLF